MYKFLKQNISLQNYRKNSENKPLHVQATQI